MRYIVFVDDAATRPFVGTGVLGFVEKVVNILLRSQRAPFEQFVECSNKFSELEITGARIRKRKGEMLEGRAT